VNRRFSKVVLAASLVAAPLAVVANDAAPASATSLHAMTFAYDWPVPDMELIPVLVAKENGYFTKAGLNVSIKFPPNTSTTIKMLSTGSADVGLVTTADMVSAVVAKVPLKSIANYSMSNNWGLFTKPGTTIPLSQLKGKTIFSYDDNWTNTMLPFVLKKAGVTAQQVHVVSASNDVPLLLNGRVNFSTNTTNYEIPGIEAADKGKQPGEVLTGSALGVPNIPIWDYATSTSFAGKNGTYLKAFLSAVKQATKWAVANPTAAATLFDKAYPSSGYTNAYNLSAWKLTVPLLANAKGQYFVESDTQWSQLTSAMKAVKEIASEPSPSSIYTNAFQPTS